jgi:hypothetical protein
MSKSYISSPPLRLHGDSETALSWARNGSYRIGTARHGTVRRGKTKWKQMEGRALHRPGSAQTPRAGIGTVPEYWTQQNIPKVRSVRKANNCFEAKSFVCFSAVIQFLLLYHGNKKTSNK